MSDRTTPDETDEPTPDEIEPMVPYLPTTGTDPTPLADGGPDARRTRPERPPATDHASPADRHREEIAPLVPDLR